MEQCVVFMIATYKSRLCFVDRQSFRQSMRLRGGSVISLDVRKGSRLMGVSS